MLTLDQRERMRRAYYIDHKSIRQIAAEEGHSREAVSNKQPVDLSRYEQLLKQSW